MDRRLQGLPAQLGLHSKLVLIGHLALLRRYTRSLAMPYR